MDSEQIKDITQQSFEYAVFVIGIVMFIYSGMSYIVGNIQISIAMGVLCIAFRVAIRY